MRGSECSWLRSFFEEDADAASDKQAPILGGAVSGGGGKRSKLREQSVGSQFQEQLGALTKLLDSAQTYFVRCVCANAERTPRSFDARACVTQLR
ncbi:hypothetical protein T492DRAFT_867307 [Pavlovales sp. CCMP2436]|nr:hypothetical protein T492DRAFT_867307 [Pavlovales sp. CCMP2436]